MPLKMKAVPISDSEESEHDHEEEEKAKKRVKIVKDPSKRFVGGIVVNNETEVNEHLASASLSASEKKGLKEVKELERELDLKNTFSRETNRRDEDAEMNKYIDEQIRQRREALKKEREKKTLGSLDSSKNSELKSEFDLSEIYDLPAGGSEKIDTILLHSLSKNLASTSDERSEAMLSSQMLNGIPEVDLGISERIRTIEVTEEAKLRLASTGSSRNTSKKHSTVPVNFSSNFQHHRYNRDSRGGELKTSSDRSSAKGNKYNEPKTVVEPVVVVGEEPEAVEYRIPSKGERPPPKGKASDDYYLSKFKKNNRK